MITTEKAHKIIEEYGDGHYWHATLYDSRGREIPPLRTVTFLDIAKRLAEKEDALLPIVERLAQYNFQPKVSRLLDHRGNPIFKEEP